jgi:hypothetical protein
LLFGCATPPQVIRTGNNVRQEYSPTSTESIEIFRSLRPQWKYLEIGAITLHNVDDVKLIFEKFRIEAGKNGANGIIDFDIDSESKIVSEYECDTDSEGQSNCKWVEEREVFYFASGTLISKAQEER